MFSIGGIPESVRDVGHKKLNKLPKSIGRSKVRYVKISAARLPAKTPIAAGIPK